MVDYERSDATKGLSGQILLIRSIAYLKLGSFRRMAVLAGFLQPHARLTGKSHSAFALAACGLGQLGLLLGQNLVKFRQRINENPAAV